jgi:hypothetical protein
VGRGGRASWIEVSSPKAGRLDEGMYLIEEIRHGTAMVKSAGRVPAPECPSANPGQGDEGWVTVLGRYVVSEKRACARTNVPSKEEFGLTAQG